MTSLRGKTLFISGGSRGIGRAIALRAARDGANVIIAAKTADPHPKLEGTIHETAQAVVAAGGQALATACDIRSDDQIAAAVAAGVQRFGGIDICVNNASAIFLAGTLETPMKRFDLMFSVNVRGTYAVSQACLPHLLKSANPHILNLAPPINLNPRWFESHLAYTMAKYGMSMCVLGMAAEFADRGVAVNALWPKTAIATAAIDLITGQAGGAGCRSPDIMSDAAHAILIRPSREHTGRFFIDEDVLRGAGTTDFARYAPRGGGPLLPDFFLDET